MAAEGKSLKVVSESSSGHFSLLHSLVILCRSGEEDVAARVQGCLNAVLDHADDKADGDCLHGYVVADVKERAGHRYEQQRTACHA